MARTGAHGLLSGLPPNSSAESLRLGRPQHETCGRSAVKPPPSQYSRSLKAVAPVQIRSGLLKEQQVKGLIAGYGGQALDHLSVVRP